MNKLQAVLVTMVLGIVGLGTAQSGLEGQVGAGGKAPFSLTISSAQTVFSSNSEIYVDITVTNTGSQLLMVPRVDLDIRDLDGKSVPLTEEAKSLLSQGSRPGSQRSPVLGLGQSEESEVIANKVYDLSKQGQYTIQAVAFFGQTVVKSNLMTLTVSEPETSKQEIFSLLVNAPHSTVKEGLPILLKTRLLNTSNRDLLVDNAKFDLQITDSLGVPIPTPEASKKLRKQQAESQSHNIFSLRPGEVLRINIDANRFFGLRQGKYVIQVVKIDDESGSVVKSNPVTVTIVP